MFYDIKVTKMIANAQIFHKNIIGHPFTDSGGDIFPLTYLKSSQVTRGQKQYFDDNS